MNDDKHNPAPGEDDEAFWEDEGGDRTITSPFEPPELGASAMPSPVSDAPPRGVSPDVVGTRPVEFAPAPLGAPLPSPTPSPVAKPELPTRAHDSEHTRAVSGDAFFPFQDLGAFPPPPLPDLGPPAAPFADDHVVVGEGAVGDEATIAVAAPSPGSANIAAALAATLGAGALAPEVWSSRGAGPPVSPGPASPGPIPLPRTSPVASTLGGAVPSMSSSTGTPLSVPLTGPGVPGAPFGIRDPASQSMQVASPLARASHPSHGSLSPQPASSPGMPAAPYASGHGSQPGIGPVAPSPTWPTSPGPMRAPVATGPAYGAYGAGPAPTAVAPAPAQGRSQTVLLAVVGVVCLTIFVVGVVLFLRS